MEAFFKRLRQYLVRLHRHVVVEPWPLWVLAALPFAIPLVLSPMLAEMEPRLRLAGLALQLLGVATVAVGIRNVRKQFGLPGIIDKATETARALRWPEPKGRVFNVEVREPAGISASMSAAAAIGIAVQGPTPTVEQRLAGLERSLQGASQSIAELRTLIADEVGARKAGIEAEEKRRAEADSVVGKALQDATAGGIRLNAMGVVLLFEGLVLSTASMELAKILG